MDQCLDYIYGTDLVGEGVVGEVEEVEEEVDEEETSWVPKVLEFSEVKDESDRLPVEKSSP